jgi:hypothetical protein
MFPPIGGGRAAYQIANSLRFRSSASAYLSRTFGTPTDNLKWTWSGWVKRGTLGAVQCIYAGGANDSGYNSSAFRINASDKLEALLYSGGVLQANPITNAVFRDPSAHYHIVIVYDSANGTQANRLIFYVNGASQSVTGTLLSPSLASKNNANGVVNSIGRTDYAANYLSGYLSDIYFIDGQALTPGDFAETNAEGVWVPKAYTGSYGNNGFYLPFDDATSTTTLGYDRSGNANNWTCNNISLTAGVTYDHMEDTPTNNYAVLNPIDQGLGGTLSGGNLNLTAASGNLARRGTIPIEYDAYWEIKATANARFGLVFGDQVEQSGGFFSGSAAYYILNSGSAASFANCTVSASVNPSWSAGDIISFAYTKSTNTVSVRANDIQITILTVTSPTTKIYPMVCNHSSGVATDISINFGQRPFTYTPPTGFKALCTANLPTVAITNPREHFDTAIFTMGAVDKTVTVDGNGNNLALQPDLIWHKARNNSQSHYLVDSVRGGSSLLRSSTTGAESTGSTFISAFSSPGYTATTALLTNTYPYAAWLWKANGAGVGNTDGTITSTVSANTTAGFSIVTYTGTGVAGTVGHGLGAVPKLVIVKNRSVTGDWEVRHASIAATKSIYLNLTNAETTSPVWNNTAPTSSVFSVGTASTPNGSGNNLVAYCFAEIAGFSKFGSYTGNGSTDGPFVFCGFRPKYVLIKRSDSAEDWRVVDTARTTYNAMGEVLYPNTSGAAASPTFCDLTASGFKIRSTDVAFNGSGGTYIFCAFAEHPFGGSNISPSPAR